METSTSPNPEILQASLTNIAASSVALTHLRAPRSPIGLQLQERPASKAVGVVESFSPDEGWRIGVMYVCMYVRTYVCLYACMHVNLWNNGPQEKVRTPR